VGETSLGTVGSANGIMEGAMVESRSSTTEVKAAVGAIVASDGSVRTDSVMSSDGTEVGIPCTVETMCSVGTAEGTRSRTDNVFNSVGAEVGRIPCTALVKAMVGDCVIAGGMDRIASVIISVGTAEGTPCTEATTDDVGTADGTRSCTADVRIPDGDAVDTLSCTPAVTTFVGDIVVTEGGNERIDSVITSDGTDVGTPATAEPIASVGMAVGNLSRIATVFCSLGATVGRFSFTASVKAAEGAKVISGGTDLMESVISSVGILDGTLKTADVAKALGIADGILSNTASLRISDGAAVGTLPLTATVNKALGAAVTSGGSERIVSVISSEGTPVGRL
jgi:hypothetical protein